MPSRWFVPIHGVDPQRVRLEFVHGAFSGWFDRTTAEHTAGDKPYAVSPLTNHRGQVGVQVGLLSDVAHQRFIDVTSAPTTVRLGNQIREIGQPKPLRQATWTALAREITDRQWTLDLVTPTTFRSGDRSSPLPAVETIVSGLARSWKLWCDQPDLVPLPTPTQVRSLWISDLDLTTEYVDMTINGRSVRFRGALGSITLRADDDDTARWAGPLLNYAAYAGVGSMRAKGLGVAELRRPSAERTRRSA